MLLGALLILLSIMTAGGRAEDSASTNKASVFIVVGAAGDDEYREAFAKAAQLWSKAAQEAGARAITIGLDPAEEPTDRQLLETQLQAEPTDIAEPLWVVLLGHGTYDGKRAKFNLRGPDFTAEEFSKWLRPALRPVVLVNCASASAPFLHALSSTNRVIITATRSGFEQNYARFGRFFAEALTSPDADLDKDNQNSALEAFLFAANRVAEFYDSEGRLATEHPLIDDNGDGKGTPPDWFRGVRAIKKAADNTTPDGARAHQFHLVQSQAERQFPPALRAKRDQLEMAIFHLRDQKDRLPADDYYQKLEALFLDLARIYSEAERPAGFE